MKVLLHTFMDALRDDDDREINNHGNPIPVDEGKKDLLTKSDTKVTKNSMNMKFNPQSTLFNRWFQ